MEQFFSDIERKCFKAADDLPLSDKAARERAYDLIHLSRKFRTHLEYYARNGEVWSSQIDELLKPSKKPLLGGLLGG